MPLKTTISEPKLNLVLLGEPFSRKAFVLVEFQQLALLLDVVQKRIVRGMGSYHCMASVEGKRVASCEILCAGRKE